MYTFESGHLEQESHGKRSGRSGEESKLMVEKKSSVSESGGLSLRVQNSAATLTDVSHRCGCFNRQVWFMSLI